MGAVSYEQMISRDLSDLSRLRAINVDVCLGSYLTQYLHRHIHTHAQKRFIAMLARIEPI